MSVEQVPRTRCDRPGCGATVTDRGGRFALTSGGLEPHIDGESLLLSVDLCRGCAESLRTWWTSKEARAATKAAP